MQSAHFTAALPNHISVRDSGANQHACSVCRMNLILQQKGFVTFTMFQLHKYQVFSSKVICFLSCTYCLFTHHVYLIDIYNFRDEG